MSWLEYFFGFRGRISRNQFWFFFLLMIPLSLFCIAIDALIGLMWPNSLETYQRALSEEIVVTALSTPLLVVAGVGQVAIWTKRLHDRNMSGWWQAIFALPVTSMFVAFDALPDNVTLFRFAVGLAAIGYIGCVWVLVQAWAMRGTSGPNRFGPDPLKQISSHQ